MNKKGFEMVMSTLVIIVLAVIVLAVLIFAFTGGFNNFLGRTGDLTPTDLQVAKAACTNVCAGQSGYDFCCLNIEAEIGNKIENITCQDSRVGVECDINCENVNCEV